MRIELKKFGELLVSRPAGREAFLTTKAYTLPDLNESEKIEIDFKGVLVLTPSWADEFLNLLAKDYPGRIKLLPADNPTVKNTLDTISFQQA